jgi:hypothetical protein
MKENTLCNEYLLVIEIPKLVTEKIELVRNEILGNYKITQPRTGKPTIVLARFVLPTFKENNIKYLLHNIFSNEEICNIHLKNFGGYPLHCIYINIENQIILLNMIDKLKTLRNSFKMQDEAPYYLQDPIIPLVAKMDKDVYLNVMKTYKNKLFFESFTADKILLLKRNIGAEKFTIAHHFNLQNVGALRNLQFA